MSQAAIQIETTIYNEDDSAIHIRAMLVHGMKARRNKYGAMESPDDDNEIEIVNVVCEDGFDVSLTDKQTETAMEQLENRE